MIDKSLSHKISNIIYKAINEAMTAQPINEYHIKNPGLYNLDIKTICPICMNGIKQAIWGKVQVIPNKGRAGADVHRASFRVKVYSLERSMKSQIGDDCRQAPESYNILCKVYNPTKMDDTVSIDYEAIIGGYYSHIASIISGVAYYLPVSEIYRYQEKMGNRCISSDGRFININADFFCDNSQWGYTLTPEEASLYDSEYNRATRVNK
jgi:hypothetical protein